MPNSLALSFASPLAPSFDLRGMREDSARPEPDGWGLGFYPGGEPSAQVLKEPRPSSGSMRSQLVHSWEYLESSVFMMHIRRARWGARTDANTQPFRRAWAGRDWIFSHSGSLTDRVEPPDAMRFEPIGATDTELVFCQVLSRIADRGWRTLAECDLAQVREWLREFNAHGPVSISMSDGVDLVAYADETGAEPVYAWQVAPPYPDEGLKLKDAELKVDLFGRGGTRMFPGVVFASSLMDVIGPHATWQRLTPGRLAHVRHGVLHEVYGLESDAPIDGFEPLAPEGPLRARPQPKTPEKREPATLRVAHRTVYTYDKPVERSTHLFRLTPITDHLQNLASWDVSISVPGQRRPFVDAFGNRCIRLDVDEPFDEMVIEAKGVVNLLDVDPLSCRLPHQRSAIPVVWMPSARNMLQPYLVPPELPDTQLMELSAYAMSFVERNGFDLLETLLDINETIYREYAYRQGVTTLFTTAYECFVNRRGVCQDFTNLFICMARLLGLPARYVCGYLYTGPKHDNQVQSEASHAWVQVYLPDVGWLGFDPTNGVLTQTDHVRVAVGRNYVDATPTGGTLYVGGGGERLKVDVRVAHD